MSACLLTYDKTLKFQIERFCVDVTNNPRMQNSDLQWTY